MPAPKQSAGFVKSLVFPARSRTFPGQRVAKIVARSVHVLCVAGFFGGHVHGVTSEQLAPWFVATLTTGVVILLLDLYQNGAFLVQARGMVLFGKLGLLFTAWNMPENAVPLLSTIIIISVCSSHAPSKFRYYVVLGREHVVGEKTPG